MRLDPISVLIVTGLAGLAIVEAAMNGYAGWSTGPMLELSMIMCGIYVANEFVKAGAASVVGRAARAMAPFRFVAALLMLTATVSLSLAGHITFIGLARGDKAAARELVNARVEDASATLAQDRQRLSVLLASPRYAKSSGCTRATVEASISLCDEVRAIEQRLDAARTTVAANDAVGVGDPAVAVMAWIIPRWTQNDRMILLAIVMAIAIETMTALGFFAVGYHRPATPKPRPVAPAVDAVIDEEVQTLERTLGALKRDDRRERALGSSPLRSPMTIEHAVRQGIIEHPGVHSVMAFREAMLETATGAVLPFDDAYEAYQAWCGSRDDHEPMHEQIFRRLFVHLAPVAIDRSGYAGLRLREDVERVA